MFKIKLSLFVLITLFIISCDQTVGPLEPFNSPTNFCITKVDYGELKLTWQDNTDREMQYQIDRKAGEGEWEEEFRLLPANTVSFTDTDVSVSGEYIYRVFAYNFDESSGYAEEIFYYEFNEVETILCGNDEPYIIRPDSSEYFSFNLTTFNGQATDPEYEVYFNLQSAPEGVYLQANSESGNSISQTTQCGYVEVRVHTGNVEGIILLKVHTFKTTGEVVAAEYEISVGYPEVSDIEIISEHLYYLDKNETYEVTIELRSSYWEVVQEEYEVFFLFTEKPDGTNLDGVLYKEIVPYMKTTINGRSTVQLNTGMFSGSIELRIFTFTSFDEEVFLTKDYTIID